MSISLDFTGLLRFSAFWVARKGGNSGKLLYLYLYSFFLVCGVIVGNVRSLLRLASNIFTIESGSRNLVRNGISGVFHKGDGVRKRSARPGSSTDHTPGLPRRRHGFLLNSLLQICVSMARYPSTLTSI